MPLERISSTAMSRPGGGFDVFAPARAAARVANVGKAIGQALEEKDAAQFQVKDRDARLFAQVERARIQRELAADIDQVRNEVPETGAGFAQAAISRYDQRVSEARARAGKDPLRLRRLDEAFQIEREDHLAVFEKAERGSLKDYTYNQHLLALDDYRQQIGRTKFVSVPNTWRERLGQSESGGNYGATNDEGMLGKYQHSPARLREYKNASGETFTDAEYLKNGPLQERAQAWMEGDIDEYILAQGLERFVGQEINGVVMTQGAMRGVAHLGGKLGLHKFLTTGGKYNPADSNGTSLTDYARQHGGTDRLGVPFFSGPLPDLKKNPAFQTALADTLAQIDAMEIPKADKIRMKRQAEAELTQAALLSVGEDNPGTAMAMLRSGDFDRILSYKQSTSLEGAMQSSIEAIEKSLATSAKDQARAFKDEATAAFDDWKAWGENGGSGDRPEFSPEHFDALTMKQQREARTLSEVWQAREVANTIPMEQAVEFLEALQPSGTGYAGEKEAFDAAEEILTDRFNVQEAEQHVAAAVAAGVLPNMSDPDVRDLLDERLNQAIADSDDPLATSFEFLDQYRVAPKAINHMIAGIMGGDNPEMKQALAARLSTTNPRALANLDQGPVEQALALDEWLGLGLSMEEAEGLSKEMVKPANKGLHDARADQWKDKDLEIPDAVLGVFTEQIAEEMDAVLPSSVWSEYEEIARQKYLSTGRPEVAGKLAATAFLRRHDVTMIGPERWQRDPPERVYSVYGDRKRDAAWIEDQALALARKEFPGATAVTVETQRDQGRSEEPVYTVMTVDAEGTIQQVLAPFKPDRTAEIEVFQRHERVNSAEAEKRNTVAVQRAKLRDAEIERSRLYQEMENASRRHDLEGAPESEVLEAIKAFQDQARLVDEMRGEHERISDELEPPKTQPRTGTRASILEDERFDRRYGRQ